MEPPRGDVRTIFDRAWEMESPAARTAYLDEACAGNPTLRREVESLLAAHGAAGDFLERPAVEMVSAAPAPDATATFDVGAKGDRAEPAGPDPETPLDFLQPSATPGSLGRLGHYEVLEILGRGGFGIVFRAFDEKLHRVVALKVLAPHLAATSPARKRFLREARAAASVRHDNVVAIYAVEDQPIPYLVMEYLAGQTLQQRLDGNGPLDVKEVLRIGRQIADGLAAAHGMGIIHRDVKPANILLENGVDRVKLTDFGLARAADDASLSQSGVAAGTPMYMAPEQALGEALDQRADLFRLGSVLYQMCTGRPPFRAATTLAVLKRVVEDAPRPVREIIPEVPDWLCAIVARLHAKKPEDRYASAKEVADLLGSRLAELQLRGAVQTPGPSSPEPSPIAPRARRRRYWRVFATVAVLSLIPLALVALKAAADAAGLTDALVRWAHPAPPPATTTVLHPTQELSRAVAPFDAKQAQYYQEAWAKWSDVPVEVENSIGMKLRFIPPGEFVMGSSREEVETVLKATGNDAEWFIRSEAPPHTERIEAPFFLATYETTVGQFRRFVAETGYRTRAEADGKGGLTMDDKGRTVNDPAVAWNKGIYAASNDHPVCVLMRPDAEAFCDWLRTKEGVSYVLPDEEHWEYACRAGTTGRWCSGDDPERARQFGWYMPESGGLSHPVGSKLPNAFGLFDMHGNVEEWVEAPQGAPAMRGGDVGGPSAWYCRSAGRPPVPAAQESPWPWWGFRVAVVGDLGKFGRR